jgi:tRNA G18 (ribose-2'-O)-methylase SpoU
MVGTAGSLNLAVAAGVLLYEARRNDWATRLQHKDDPSYG